MFNHSIPALENYDVQRRVYQPAHTFYGSTTTSSCADWRTYGKTSTLRHGLLWPQPDHTLQTTLLIFSPERLPQYVNLHLVLNHKSIRPKLILPLRFVNDVTLEEMVKAIQKAQLKQWYQDPFATWSKMKCRYIIGPDIPEMIKVFWKSWAHFSWIVDKEIDSWPIWY